MRKLGEILIGDPIMKINTQDYNAASEECLNLRETYGSKKFVEIIEKKISESNNPSKKLAYLEFSANQLTIVGRPNEALDLLRTIAKMNPSSVISQLSIVSHLLFVLDQPEKALEELLPAESLSNETGHFRRHVQAEKARIALALNDYDMLNAAINRISQIVVVPDKRDVGKERDFFDRADKNRLKPETISNFQKYIDEKKC
jgi:hypothetical protein